MCFFKIWELVTTAFVRENLKDPGNSKSGKLKICEIKKPGNQKSGKLKILLLTVIFLKCSSLLLPPPSSSFLPHELNVDAAFRETPNIIVASHFLEMFLPPPPSSSFLPHESNVDHAASPMVKIRY